MKYFKNNFVIMIGECLSLCFFKPHFKLRNFLAIIILVLLNSFIKESNFIYLKGKIQRLKYLESELNKSLL